MIQRALFINGARVRRHEAITIDVTLSKISNVEVGDSNSAGGILIIYHRCIRLSGPQDHSVYQYQMSYHTYSKPAPHSLVCRAGSDAPVQFVS